MTDLPDTKASTGRSGRANSHTIERLIRQAQADPALHQVLNELLPDTIADLLASELEHRSEFAALYGPGLEAMSEGDSVSAAPGSDFAPED